MEEGNIMTAVTIKSLICIGYNHEPNALTVLEDGCLCATCGGFIIDAEERQEILEGAA